MSFCLRFFVRATAAFLFGLRLFQFERAGGGGGEGLKSEPRLNLKNKQAGKTRPTCPSNTATKLSGKGSTSSTNRSKADHSQDLPSSHEPKPLSLNSVLQQELRSCKDNYSSRFCTKEDYFGCWVQNSLFGPYL